MCHDVLSFLHVRNAISASMPWLVRGVRLVVSGFMVGHVSGLQGQVVLLYVLKKHIARAGTEYVICFFSHASLC